MFLVKLKVCELHKTNIDC